MKKFAGVVLIFVMALGLSACGGDTSNVKTFEVASEMYSQEDINSAIDVIKKEFKSDWKGCKLTEIYYAGDDSSNNYKAGSDGNDADIEVIVLLSSFDVDSSGGDGSLNPDSTYNNWNWILVRKNGGQWEHVDHGY